MHHLQTNSATSKVEKYDLMLKQAKAILADEDNIIANMANITALLKQTFDWFWIGFYLVDKSANQLTLAPFQGTLACSRIDYGKGVCGEVWATGITQVVDDVNAHPNHIACSSLSKSEIVVPVYRQIDNNKEEIIAVLDIDSDELAIFDEVDARGLEKLVQLL